MPAKQGDTVKVHYTGKFDSGEVFDSSQGRDPLEFTLGTGQVISGFENAVIGMEVDEEKTVHIPSAEAYGERNEQLVQKIPRDKFSKDMNPRPGQRMQLRTQNGEAIVVMVTEVEAGTVTLDANHPLAGMDLNFDLKLVEISAIA